MTTITADERVSDRLDVGFAPQLVHAEVKAMKAHLIVASAMEMFDPALHRADMLVFARRLSIVAQEYGVPSPVLARIVRLRAADLAESWARCAA